MLPTCSGLQNHLIMANPKCLDSFAAVQSLSCDPMDSSQPDSILLSDVNLNILNIGKNETKTIHWKFRTFDLGASLVVQWLRLCTFNAGSIGWIPGWGTKIPHVWRPCSPLHTPQKELLI